MQFYELSAKDDNCLADLEKVFYRVARKVLNKDTKSAKADATISKVSKLNKTSSDDRVRFDVHLHQHHHIQRNLVVLNAKKEKEENKCCS